MRTSISQHCGRQRKIPQDFPREGSRDRRLYDYMMDRKGQVFYIRDIRDSLGYKANELGAVFENWRNFYGIDVRRIKNNWWCIAGQWEENKYIDFVALRHK